MSWGCANCGKETDNPRFCSRSCSATWNNKHCENTIESRRTKTKKCEGCDNKVYSNVKFCSHECFLEARSVRDRTEKICNKCGKMKQKEEYWVSKVGKWFGWCKECAKDDAKMKSKTYKILCVEYKGGKCVGCGYNKYLAALEFHHLDLTQKDFAVAANGYTGDYNKLSDKVTKELDKCVLLCSNCHRETHNPESIWKEITTEVSPLLLSPTPS